MTSSSDTFPFGIADVVELLGLTVRRRLPSSLYLCLGKRVLLFHLGTCFSIELMLQ